MKKQILALLVTVFGSLSFAAYGINPPKQGRPSGGYGIGDFESKQYAHRVIDDIFRLAPFEKYLIESGEDKAFVAEFKKNLATVFHKEPQAAEDLLRLRDELQERKLKHKKLSPASISRIVEELTMMTWILAEDDN